MQAEFSRFSYPRITFLLASFEFAKSCHKIKVWYMHSNGILFLQFQLILTMVLAISNYSH